jgi:hypothetical protein
MERRRAIAGFLRAAGLPAAALALLGASGAATALQRSQSMADIAVTLKAGADAARIADALAEAGLKIEGRHEAIGSITGKASPDAIPKLRAVSGVEDVSEIAPIQIAPPDSDIQ